MKENLKELIKEVERLNKYIIKSNNPTNMIAHKIGIKQAVEAVDNDRYTKDWKDWQKLKKLLGVK